MTQHNETQARTIDPTRLPPSLQIRDVSVGEALAALGNRLAELAEMMPLVTDVECSLSIDPSGKCLLTFRACK